MIIYSFNSFIPSFLHLFPSSPASFSFSSSPFLPLRLSPSSEHLITLNVMTSPTTSDPGTPPNASPPPEHCTPGSGASDTDSQPSSPETPADADAELPSPKRVPTQYKGKRKALEQMEMNKKPRYGDISHDPHLEYTSTPPRRPRANAFSSGERPDLSIPPSSPRPRHAQIRRIGDMRYRLIPENQNPEPFASESPLSPIPDSPASPTYPPLRLASPPAITSSTQIDPYDPAPDSPPLSVPPLISRCPSSPPSAYEDGKLNFQEYQRGLTMTSKGWVGKGDTILRCDPTHRVLHTPLLQDHCSGCFLSAGDKKEGSGKYHERRSCREDVSTVRWLPNGDILLCSTSPSRHGIENC